MNILSQQRLWGPRATGQNRSGDIQCKLLFSMPVTKATSDCELSPRTWQMALFESRLWPKAALSEPHSAQSHTCSPETSDHSSFE